MFALDLGLVLAPPAPLPLAAGPPPFLLLEPPAETAKIKTTANLGAKPKGQIRHFRAARGPGGQFCYRQPASEALAWGV